MRSVVVSVELQSLISGRRGIGSGPARSGVQALAAHDAENVSIGQSRAEVSFTGRCHVPFGQRERDRIGVNTRKQRRRILVLKDAVYQRSQPGNAERDGLERLGRRCVWLIDAAVFTYVIRIPEVSRFA